VSACFKKYMNGQACFETARDTIRHAIHSEPCAISLWNQRHMCFSFSISDSCLSEFCNHFKS
jgi:hypothetical protein